jgi:hypothetical protein
MNLLFQVSRPIRKIPIHEFQRPVSFATMLFLDIYAMRHSKFLFLSLIDAHHIFAVSGNWRLMHRWERLFLPGCF